MTVDVICHTVSYRSVWKRAGTRTDPGRAIPRRLGYREEATLRRRLRQPEPRDVVIYSLFRDDFDSSPAASALVEAYDAAGTRVL